MKNSRITPRKKRALALEVERLESRDLLAALVPLNDLGTGTYQGYEGGLYLNGSDTPPAATQAYALSLAQQIVPLDGSGNPDPVNGKIVMISVGMSNTNEEFSGQFSNSSTDLAFLPQANADPTKNPQLVIVNGAQGGMAAPNWAIGTNNTDPWATVDQRLASAGVTANQVEVAWVKLADPFPLKNDGAFPNDAQKLQGYLEIVARKLLTHYPHIKIAYYSSRTHAYTSDPTTINPEPFAYESGFSVQGTIQDQINGLNNLNYDPSKGTVVAPLVLWGPYLWATDTPRSDGFTWLSTDLSGDLTHPSVNGVQKVAEELLAFFKTDPTAASWFLKPATAGQGPVVTALASATTGAPGVTIQFTASATDSNATITQYAWTYADGDFSLSQNPTKTFDVPGTYDVHLTVSDSLGNSTQKTITIVVGAGGGGSGGGGNLTPGQAATGFLNPLFQDLLGRLPTASDLASYGGELENLTSTRSQVAMQIIDTSEYETDVVNALYSNILHRPADSAGLSAWVNFLAQGGTAEQVQTQLLGSDEFFSSQGGGTDTGFLNALYQDVLNRPIDSGGTQVWDQALMNGMSRPAVATAVLASQESDTDEVQALYQKFLKRAADQTGLNTFVAALQQGTSNEVVSSEIVASAEYAAYSSLDPNQLYVAQLYPDLLNRPADAAGLAQFTAALDTGSAAGKDVVQAILNSAEYRTNVVQGLYNELLRRAADSTGLTAFTNILAQGGTDEQVAAILAGSSEYYNNRGGGTNDGFLDALYQDALARSPDAAGRASWDQAMANGTTRQQVAAAIFGSQEYDQDLVQKFYQTYLHRAADSTGLNGFVNQLQSGSRDEAVILAIVTSGEYFIRTQQ
jgi:PKD repeat protein